MHMTLVDVSTLVYDLWHVWHKFVLEYILEIICTIGHQNGSSRILVAIINIHVKKLKIIFPAFRYIRHELEVLSGRTCGMFVLKV